MSDRRIVVDTNVLISAMLSEESVSRKVLDGIASDEILLMSEQVLAEFVGSLLSENLINMYHFRIDTTICTS